MYVRKHRLAGGGKSYPTFFSSPEIPFPLPSPPVPPLSIVFTLSHFPPKFNFQSPPLGLHGRDPAQGAEARKSQRKAGSQHLSRRMGEVDGASSESSMGSLFSNSNSVLCVNWTWGIAKVPLKGSACLQLPPTVRTFQNPLKSTPRHIPAYTLASLTHFQSCL